MTVLRRNKEKSRTAREILGGLGIIQATEAQKPGAARAKRAKGREAAPPWQGESGGSGRLRERELGDRR